jgi:hypothetical protein
MARIARKNNHTKKTHILVSHGVAIDFRGSARDARKSRIYFLLSFCDKRALPFPPDFMPKSTSSFVGLHLKAAVDPKTWTSG